MIALPIAAMTLAGLLFANPVDSTGSTTLDHAVGAAPIGRMAFPFPSLPTIRLPKLRMPHLPKRNGTDEAMSQTAQHLKGMVRAQESWYSDHGRYGNNSSAIARGASARDSLQDRVQVQVLYAGKKGWTAIASHADAPGKSCVVYVGYRTALPLIPRTRADAVEAVKEGQPVCDR